VTAGNWSLPRLRRRDHPIAPVPWVLAGPAVAFAVVMVLAPIGFGAWYAFTDWNGITVGAKFIGLDNFREILRNPVFRGSLVHTVEIAVAFVIAVNVAGLGLALALHRTVKSRGLLRSLFFIPVVAAPLAVAYVWGYVFDANGALNHLLSAVGLKSWREPWVADPHWALWTIVVVLVWQYCGFTMLVYLAGLQGIPDDLHEASAVDGAGAWTRFRRITLPLLAPATTVNVTLMLILGLRVFDQVLAVTNGGPDNATQTLASEVYQQTFQNGNFGLGAALALLLGVLIAAMSITQALILRRRETY
jgi:raffinose/stachyose/melibiose transport system permease protein